MATAVCTQAHTALFSHAATARRSPQTWTWRCQRQSASQPFASFGRTASWFWCCFVCVAGSSSSGIGPCVFASPFAVLSSVFCLRLIASHRVRQLGYRLLCAWLLRLFIEHAHWRGTEEGERRVVDEEMELRSCLINSYLYLLHM